MQRSTRLNNVMSSWEIVIGWFDMDSELKYGIFMVHNGDCRKRADNTGLLNIANIY